MSSYIVQCELINKNKTDWKHVEVVKGDCYIVASIINQNDAYLKTTQWIQDSKAKIGGKVFLKNIEWTVTDVGFRELATRKTKK